MRRGLAVAAVLMLSACTDDSAPGPAGTASTGGTPLPSTATTVTAAPSAAPASSAQVPSADPLCAPARGRSIEDLPDLVIPALTFPDLPGLGVGGAAVPGFTIPAQTVDGGCVVTEDAPAGCAAKVTISAAAIPEIRIPATVLPAVTVGSTTLPERTYPEVVLPAVTVAQVSTPQTCQERTEDGMPTITRPGIVRPALSRPGAARSGGFRAGACGDEGCVPSIDMPTVRLEPARLVDVDIDPVRMRRVRLADDVDKIDEEAQVTYVAPADVLFATDEAALRPEATEALEAIAAELAATTGAIRVEGHTDATATEDYNLELSARRGAAVAAWLEDEAGVDGDRITVVPRGESAPVATNETDAGRQLNRRVVVSVARM